MRVSLIFPPRASPTYVPLSLASLLAVLTQQEPTCQARVEDLNLSAWEWVAAREPAGAAALAFFHGQAATSFFDQDSYDDKNVHAVFWVLLQVQSSSGFRGFRGLLSVWVSRPAAHGSSDQRLYKRQNTSHRTSGFESERVLGRR